jgi:hypothetical protein
MRSRTSPRSKSARVRAPNATVRTMRQTRETIAELAFTLLRD